MHPFRTDLGYEINYKKYAGNQDETWDDRAHIIVNSVCGDHGGTKNNLLGKDDRDQLFRFISKFMFMPGGRYIYYSGRIARMFNNCYLFRATEDTREEWGNLWQRVSTSLMTGGGIGADVSAFRPSGRTLTRTGGISSGPIPWLYATNEMGRQVMQGGSRRSAMYGSLNWMHEDATDFLKMKNWHDMPISGAFKADGTPFTMADAKTNDFNFPCPFDMMNISLNYDDAWLANPQTEVFNTNVRQALMTGEPGFSFNFGAQQGETLRNACTEVTSSDDSDCCNLGSVNMANIETVEDFKDVVHLASKFLVCGLIRAELPTKEIEKVRQQNSRLGLGLMGMHEWLLKRGSRYEMTRELGRWLSVYETESEKAANEHCDRLFLNRPKGYRAIAPTGTISILAGTSSGVEPIPSLAYKRRYLVDGTKWKYQYAVDGTAQALIDDGISPDKIETSFDLAADPERRIKFQRDVQRYVDHAISSTINLPAWGSELNNEDKVPEFAKMIQKYASGLRGLTLYPDGSRGGQPITPVPYEEAISKRGVIYEDNTEAQCLTGVCGI